MRLFRHLVFWIALAVLGALAAQLLLDDPGYVLIRYGGWDRSTTLAGAVLILLGVLLALWLAWKVLTLPFAAFRRYRARQARTRLLEGLDALHQGHWSRAETLLAQAAQEREAALAARLGAARAARARGDEAAAAAHLGALEHRPAARALALADLALAEGRPLDALEALDAPAAQPLPPRGLLLRAEALAALNRAGEAYGLLGALRQAGVVPAARLAGLEARWAEAALRQARDANELADRWDTLPKPLRTDAAIVAAYAERAAALRWDEAAARAIEEALEANWDERLAGLYGRLAIGRLEERRARAEAWLGAHPASPMLLLTLARLARAQAHWPQAERYLHRALAQGAGSEAWEELGHGYAQVGDETRARLSYLNALRAGRGEAVSELPGRDLRQRIFDEAAIEERDEHGLPRLRG